MILKNCAIDIYNFLSPHRIDNDGRSLITSSDSIMLALCASGKIGRLGSRSKHDHYFSLHLGIPNVQHLSSGMLGYKKNRVTVPHGAAFVLFCAISDRHAILDLVSSIVQAVYKPKQP